MAWYDNLDVNSPAYNFASDDHNVIRVMAGPGTGKSFGLNRRVARLIEGGADPKKILAVTFTRTAAADLKREIQSLGIEGSSDVVAQTLHSLCFRILSRREILKITGRIPRPMLQHEITAMLNDLNNPVFGGIKEKRNRITAFEAAWARLQHEEPGYAIEEEDRQFENDLKNWLIYHKSMLIGEMIVETLNYLRNNPECKERKFFRHILVDEYQDLNKAEQVLISLLKSDGSLVVIGDDDQSIYSFRHAHPEGIRKFNEEYSDSISIDFEECRRCPQNVVNIASNLISHNQNRTLGLLEPRRGNANGEVRLLQWLSLDEEIDGLTRVVTYNIKKGIIKPEDVLILTPRRLIGYSLRDQLNSNDVNSKSYFREEALDSENAKKAFSILNLAAIPDDRVALRYLLGHGNQNYRSNSYLKLLQKSKELDIDIRDVLEKLKNKEIKLPYSSSIVEIYKEITEEINTFISTVKKDPQKIIDLLAPQGDKGLSDFREVLESVLLSLGIFESEDQFQKWLSDFYFETLERISMPDMPEKVDHVRIMSLHASKGLSAKYVIITSCVEGLIPRFFDDDLTDKEKFDALEEQRRLFYVAVTRCKNELGVYDGTLLISSFASMAGIQALRMKIPARPDSNRFMTASRFINELGPKKPYSIKGSDYLKQLLK